MSDFASLEDVKALYPDLGEERLTRAKALLSLVSAAIKRICDTSDIEPEILKLVCVQATVRTLQVGQDTPIGVTQTSWSASPYSASMSYANPTGDIYFTAFERKLLGADDGLAMYVNQRIENVPADDYPICET